MAQTHFEACPFPKHRIFSFSLIPFFCYLKFSIIIFHMLNVERFEIRWWSGCEHIFACCTLMIQKKRNGTNNETPKCVRITLNYPFSSLSVQMEMNKPKCVCIHFGPTEKEIRLSLWQIICFCESSKCTCVCCGTKCTQSAAMKKEVENECV